MPVAWDWDAVIRGDPERDWLAFLGQECADALDRVRYYVLPWELARGLTVMLERGHMRLPNNRTHMAIKQFRQNMLLVHHVAITFPKHEKVKQRGYLVLVGDAFKRLRKLANALDPDRSEARTVYPYERVWGRVYNDAVHYYSNGTSSTRVLKTWCSRHQAREARNQVAEDHRTAVIQSYFDRGMYDELPRYLDYPFTRHGSNARASAHFPELHRQLDALHID